ncbi:N-acetylmuramoyl-L-alanine amidase family protein [Pedobacter cryophilus]|uniref:N-acetylmuramoyl-L-alanine amidase n=1 Tax=Pedobacter cryophilus TaxID=2571271 RepID=A0A4U1BX21_9SPHI|nr:N-acetylmuramoyl-L-alanine amidase [Pedobacter cryophilus]TKB97542.1 N-acetylmuramoyl-L-alanine amidase [Pedobacter cryophilus]
MKITTSKRFIHCLILTSFCTILFTSAKVAKEDNYLSTGSKVKTIIIDAGHGGQDGSTHGSFSKEKDVALTVALKLGREIEAKMPGVRVVYTRTTDVFVKLYDRIGIANREKADLFISIHCNSMPPIKQRYVIKYLKGKPVYGYRSIPNPVTRGTETFVAGFNRLDEQDVAIRENASILLEKDYKTNYGGFDPNDPESYIIFSLMKNAFRDQSIKLASLVQDEYIKEGRINRGVKEQGLAVLQRAGMPAILTEIGFISNPEEEKYINSDEGQGAIINNILNAIINYKKQIES